MTTRNLTAVVALLAPLTEAWGQQIANDRTGVVYPTIQDAIDDAVAGDTLTLAAGTYVESVYVGRDLSILGGPGVYWNADSSTRFSMISAGADLVLEGIVATAGATSSVAQRVIDFEGTDLTIRDSSLYGLDELYKGGVVEGYSIQRLTMERVVLAGQAVQGGGLFANGEFGVVDLTDVTFQRTSGSEGGAIYAEQVALTCTRCTFDHVGGFSTILATDAAVLDIRQSLFCDSDGNAAEGDATFSFTANRFVGGGGDNLLMADEGTWTILNNHFLGTRGDTIRVIEGAVDVRNNLFLGTVGYGVNFWVNPPSTVAYNVFEDGGGAVLGEVLDGSNLVDPGDPLLVRWTDDGDCTDDQLWPSAASLLIDAGDPTVLDPDGTRSDIGAFGGPTADPAFHADTDGDGVAFLQDCDDTDPVVFPGNTETCDHNDNDCDGTVDEDPSDEPTWYVDCDGDGVGDPSSAVVACFAPSAPPACGAIWTTAGALLSVDDCDDTDGAMFPGAAETCAPGDQDCDGDDDRDAVDAFSYYLDDDGDGYGSEAVSSCSNGAPPGMTVDPDDCDDGTASVHPGATDPCGDEVDQDCNGSDGSDLSIRLWYPDTDGDTYGDVAGPARAACRAEPGMSEDASDCDDLDPSVHPGAVETCNAVDDDCDTTIDELEPMTWYADEDGDGIGAASGGVVAACPPAGSWVGVVGDCDDQDPERAADCAAAPNGSASAADGGGCGCAVPGSGVSLGWFVLLGAVASRRRRTA